MQKTVRLNFPQWQGADARQMIELDNDFASTDFAQGYYLGSQLLTFIAPKHKGLEVDIPVSLDYSEKALEAENGIASYQTLLNQFNYALDILEKEQPDKVVTLGGECSVSLAPFTYLINHYQEDITLVWIDAHPDLNVPNGQDYRGFHAMVQASLLGIGDQQFKQRLKQPLSAEKALIVGLHGGQGLDLPEKFSVSVVSAEKANASSAEILDFLKKTAAKKVMIHFDLDSIDADELRLGVSDDVNGIKVESATRIINDIAQQYDLVGLTIAEHIPHTLLKLRRLLKSLTLLNE